MENHHFEWLDQRTKWSFSNSELLRHNQSPDHSLGPRRNLAQSLTHSLMTNGKKSEDLGPKKAPLFGLETFLRDIWTWS